MKSPSHFNWKRLFGIWWVGLIFSAIPSVGVCLDASVDSAGEIVSKYKEVFTGVEAVVAGYAQTIFFTMAVFGLIVVILRHLLNGSPPEKAFFAIATQVSLASLFGLLMHLWPTVSGEIVAMFRNMAVDISGVKAVTPGGLLEEGLDLFSAVAEKLSLWSPVASTAMIIASTLVLVVYALIAAILAKVLVEMYLVLGLGVVFIAFGALDFTRQYAINQLKYPLHVGVRLLVIQVLAGIGQSLLTGFTDPDATTLAEIAGLVGAAIILLYLISSLPDVMVAMLQGESVVGNHGVMAAIGGAAGGAAGAMVGATGALVAGTSAVSSAVDLAKARGATGFTGVTKAAVVNLASGIKEEAGRTVMGAPRSMQGTFWGRAAQQMVEEASKTNRAK